MISLLQIKIEDNQIIFLKRKVISAPECEVQAEEVQVKSSGGPDDGRGAQETTVSYCGTCSGHRECIPTSLVSLELIKGRNFPGKLQQETSCVLKH